MRTRSWVIVRDHVIFMSHVHCSCLIVNFHLCTFLIILSLSLIALVCWGLFRICDLSLLIKTLDHLGGPHKKEGDFLCCYSSVTEFHICFGHNPSSFKLYFPSTSKNWSKLWTCNFWLSFNCIIITHFFISIIGTLFSAIKIIRLSKYLFTW